MFRSNGELTFHDALHPAKVNKSKIYKTVSVVGTTEAPSLLTKSESICYNINTSKAVSSKAKGIN